MAAAPATTIENIYKRTTFFFQELTVLTIDPRKMCGTVADLHLKIISRSM
jgi:hypothetical protein